MSTIRALHTVCAFALVLAPNTRAQSIACESTNDAVRAVARECLPFTVPGFMLHTQLQVLVDAGLTPLQALQTATLNPARFFGATDSLGTIAPGKLADLVLLDADPLRDIANTRKIRAVVLGDRYVDRAALDLLLREAEKTASAK